MGNVLTALTRVLQQWMRLGIFGERQEAVMERWMDLFL